MNVFHIMINSPQTSLLDHPKISRKMFLNIFPAVGHGGLQLSAQVNPHWEVTCHLTDMR